MRNEQATRSAHRWIGRIGLSLLLLAPTQTRAVIDTWSYQLPMAPAPMPVSEAIATMPARASTVIGAMACGDEFGFIGRFVDKDNSEDIAVAILGKMAWTQRAAHFTTGIAAFSQPCEIKIAVVAGQVCRVFDANCRSSDAATSKAAAAAFATNPAWLALTNWPDPGGYTPDVKPLRDQILSLLPTECANDADGNERYSVTASTPSTKSPAEVRLTFKIATTCLMGQANAALLQMSRGSKQVGTTGAPCHIFGTTEGDWDSTLKDLIRIAELDRQTPALSPEARKYLNDQLIDIDGGPAQESYHFWECGNEEQSAGDPQTRSDEHDGFDHFMDDLGDTFVDLFWLFLIILLAVAAALAALYLAGGGGPLIAAIGATAVVAGVAATVALLTVPETENHLWMINSTKYINNQYIIANGGTGWWDDQNALRKWILDELQKVMKKDFLEYNARPYQRYSLASIANLAEFAQDVDVRTGAQLVLEYAIAKYSVTSSEGRRIAPYRRKREYLKFVDGLDHESGPLSTPDPPKNGLFDLEQGADYMHALGLYYYGVSLNLLEFDGSPYAATISYASQAIYAATSSFRPDEATFSLALERGHSPLVHQRIHHYGWEIVSSGAAFTITAGGLPTGLPKNVTIDAIDQLMAADDLGVAVATVVMLQGPVHHAPTFEQNEATRPVNARRSTWDRFLRFEGKRPPPIDKAPSYDHNMCVWDGFACGVNVVVPDDLKAPCMKAGSRSHWFFVRSDDPDCAAYKSGPVFWMVVYDEPRFGVDVDDFGAVYSIGFVEIVDGDEMTFADFKARVEARNPGPGAPMSTSSGCSGSYVSARGTSGQSIEFNCKRVTKVNGAEQPHPDDWGHAGAPPSALGYAPIQSSGTGKIEITSQIAKRKVTLDFEQWDNPMFNVTALP